MKLKRIIKNCLPYGIVQKLTETRQKKWEMEFILSASEEPPVYNADGRKLKPIYLQGQQAKQHPYTLTYGRYPNYILWDRSNWGLRNHIYTHGEMLKIKGKPVRKIAYFREPYNIAPQDYKPFTQHPGLEKEFDALFTHSDRLLDKFENALFVPGNGVWYGTPAHGGKMDPEKYKYKTKNISFVCSTKVLCELHKFRLGLAFHCKDGHFVDTYGNFDGGPYIRSDEIYELYRYNIAIENEINSYFFSERLLSCFASMTIPIYLGATKIGKFFNTDGIIQLPYSRNLRYDEVDKILASCNEEDYTARLPAIIDNYARVQEYLSTDDYIYTHYKEYFV